MRKFIIWGIMLVVSVLCVCGFYYFRWRHFWSEEPPISVYKVTHRDSDTIRVLVIGDSWAAMHSEQDSFLCDEIQKLISKPIKVVSRGKGGEKSRGIYHMLFDKDNICVKSLIVSGVDYCVIFAGINDAASNLGVKQFCHHYKLILDFLLENDIRPVVIEIPDVDIWHIYCNKSIKDLMADYLKSFMTRSEMYSIVAYRQALYKMLQENYYSGKVLYIPTSLWNGKDMTINPMLFLPDKIHLNSDGYCKLDECIAFAIGKDYLHAR